LEAGKIEDAYGSDGFGDFLSVGSNILDGCAAYGAGDSGETLDAGVVVINGVGDEAVPVFSGGDAKGFGLLLDTFEDDMKDDSGKAPVGDEKIAASTENEKRQAVRSSEVDGFEDVVFRRCFGEPARGTADFEGGVKRQRDVFAELQTHRLFLRVFKFLLMS
jgi:hypothetical protein